MTIATGTLLVLVTWGLWSLIMVLAGLLPALATVSRSTGVAQLLRISVWWGLLLVTIFTLGVSIIWPLGGPQTALGGLTSAMLLGIFGLILLRRRGLRWTLARPTASSLILAATALIVTTYFALAALGPVTNYDSGLYHLGAIRYAAEYPVIPGLANLYFPFGYGTAQFPLAALMTNGPWGPEGYRLLNGLILTLAATDLVLRIAARKRGPGFYVLAVGLVATWVPMVALSDYWVTSPSQDSAALTLSVVASAYLTDAVRGGKNWLGLGNSAVAVSTVLTLIRPTMGIYLIGVLLVLFILLMRRKSALRIAAAPVALGLGLGAVALIVTTARDRLLSGWAQYPLSSVPFNVPWRASDPTPVREATLGYHRNPDDLWNSIHGWEWVGPWVSSRLQQWETYEMFALAAVALVLLTVALVSGQRRGDVTRMALATAPSVIALLAWWLATPPSYRFAWGALFTVATVPMGWSLWILRREYEQRHRSSLMNPTVFVGLMAFPVLLVVAYSSLFRLDLSAMTQQGVVNIGLSIPVKLAPVVDAPVSEVETDGGFEITVPLRSDQCWLNYPLCTPDPNPDLATLKVDWSQGLTVS